MFGWLNKNNRIIRQALKQNPTGALQQYLLTPMVDKNQPVLDTDFLVLDFETTGLDHRLDHIISLGYTHIKAGRIQLNKSQHILVKTAKKLTSDNVSIHQITDDVVSQGIAIEPMMNTLLELLAGKALVAHHHSIETQFINAVSHKLFGHPIPMCVVDTLDIEKKRLQRLNRPYQPNQLRLFNLREQYNLPRYHAHNALEDALATAELLLAQIKHRQHEGYQLKLKDILS